jgi:hypothetical protein
MPEESSKFTQIRQGCTSGGQDWSSLAGSVLCEACYSRFRKSGALQGQSLAASARRCTHAGCKRPEESRIFTQIRQGCTAGGQDWSSLAGSVLCEACYLRFMTKGTLDRQQRSLPHSKAARSDLKPEPVGQVAAERGGKTGKRKAACQNDDMGGKGDQEERTRLLHASMDVDWWDTTPPGDQPDTQGSERKAHKKNLI